MDAYTSHAWRAVRVAYLSTHATCVDCGSPATQPDHVPPRRILIALGISNPDHERWLRPRCSACHSRKTRTVDDDLLKRFESGVNALTLAEEAMTHEYKTDKHQCGMTLNDVG